MNGTRAALLSFCLINSNPAGGPAVQGVRLICTSPIFFNLGQGAVSSVGQGLFVVLRLSAGRLGIFGAEVIRSLEMDVETCPETRIILDQYNRRNAVRRPRPKPLPKRRIFWRTDDALSHPEN